MATRRLKMKVLGLDHLRPDDGTTREAVRHSMIACPTCDEVKACRGRFGDKRSAGKPPELCPNSHMFRFLMEATGP